MKNNISLILIMLYALFESEIQWAISQIPLPAKIIIALATIGVVVYQAIKNNNSHGNNP